MRRRGAGVMAAAVLWGGLAAAAGGSARAEDLPQAPVKTGGWWGVLFKDKSDDKPAATPASPAQPAIPAAAPGTLATVDLPASEAAPAVPASTVLQQAEEAYQRERQAWVRRVEVCDRLREIALIKGDSEMENQANVLEAQAWQVWEQRTARLPRPAPSGKRPAETNINAAAGLGSHAPLHKSPSQLSEGQGLGRGTVTGEEKP